MQQNANNGGGGGGCIESPSDGFTMLFRGVIVIYNNKFCVHIYIWVYIYIAIDHLGQACLTSIS